MKLEDLVVGKKYKINKPEDTDVHPFWETEMDYIDQSEVLLGDNLNYYCDGTTLVYRLFQICPSWLTLVGEGESDQPSKQPDEEDLAFTSTMTFTKGTDTEQEHNHYFKDCPYDKIDIYRTIELFDITDPCLQHAFKKIACTGKRGHKDINKDVQDIIDTLERWKEMREEEEGL